MCFSADASFGVSAILLPAGAYCVASAVRKDRALLGLAVIPFVFSAQQFVEGLVWAHIGQDDPAVARAAAFVFLYFALAFWPFWIPLCAFLTETNARKRRFIALLVLLGFAGGLALYLPVALNPGVLTVTVRNHSIYYDISHSPAFDALPRPVWRVLYVTIVGVPLVIAPSRGFVLLGIALLVAAAVTHTVYWYAFTSVWCFFAALLSLYLCISFRRLPSRVSTAVSASG